jgi:hypothetical protein
VRSTIALLQLPTSRRNVRQLAPAAALLILICQSPPTLAEQASRQESNELGAIEGQVVDLDGAPLQGVTVAAHDDEGRPSIAAVPVSLTDADGHFRLASVTPGWVRLTTSKQEDGYSDTLWLALVGADYAVPPVVFVGEGETTSNVVVRIGPKCGKLVGRVVDASTGKPLLGPQLKLSREDTPEDWMMRGPDEDGTFLVA